MTGTEAANAATTAVGCVTVCVSPWVIRWMRNNLAEVRALRAEFDKIINAREQTEGKS